MKHLSLGGPPLRSESISIDRMEPVDVPALKESKAMKSRPAAAAPTRGLRTKASAEGVQKCVPSAALVSWIRNRCQLSLLGLLPAFAAAVRSAVSLLKR